MSKPLAVLVALAIPLGCEAGSSISTSATLSFSITVPGFIFLRVGTGGAPSYGTNATIDSVVFDVPLTKIGSGAKIASTGGDLGQGTVTMQARGSVGSTQVRMNVSGALSNGKGDFIPWSQITIAASTVTGPLGNTSFPGTSFVLDGWSFTFANTVWPDGNWYFIYLNQTLVPPGTYGGTVAKNGRITFTATAL